MQWNPFNMTTFSVFEQIKSPIISLFYNLINVTTLLLLRPTFHVSAVVICRGFYYKIQLLSVWSCKIVGLRQLTVLTNVVFSSCALAYLWSVFSLTVLRACYPRESKHIIVILTSWGWSCVCHTLSRPNLFSDWSLLVLHPKPLPCTRIERKTDF